LLVIVELPWVSLSYLGYRSVILVTIELPLDIVSYRQLPPFAASYRQLLFGYRFLSLVTVLYCSVTVSYRHLLFSYCQLPLVIAGYCSVTVSYRRLPLAIVELPSVIVELLSNTVSYC